MRLRRRFEKTKRWHERGVLLEDFAGQSREAVIPHAEIRRCDRDEDAEGRGHGDHARPSVVSISRLSLGESNPGATATVAKDQDDSRGATLRSLRRRDRSDDGSEFDDVVRFRGRA
jgi:hypothetical protein